MFHVAPAGALGAGEGYVAENAGLFDGAGYGSRTLSGTPTDQDVFTVRIITKRGELGAVNYLFSAGPGSTTTEDFIGFDASDRIFVRFAGTTRMVTTAVFRDPTAHMEIVLACDYGASGSDKAKLYVNGVEITAFSTDTRSSITTTNQKFNTNTPHHIGASAPSPGTSEYEGYISEVSMVDGTQLTPSSFGETDNYGNWLPKNLSGLTFGTNGFWIKDPSTGTDSSGNGNDFSVTGTITQVSDTPTDSVSKGVGNFATWNPLHYGSRTSSVTFSNGNRTISNSGASADSMVLATLAIDASLDTYFEVETASGASLPAYVGICKLTDLSFDKSANPYTNGTLTNYGYRSSSGNLLTDSVGEAGTAYGASWTDGDRIGVRLNAGTLTFYKDGVSQGTAATGITGLWFPMFIGGGGTWNATGYFADDVITNMPSGSKSLATQNLPESTAKRSDVFVDAYDTETNIESTLAAARSAWTGAYVDFYFNLDGTEDNITQFSHDGSNEHAFGTGSHAHQARSTLSGANNWGAFSFQHDGTNVVIGAVSHTNGADTTVTTNHGNANCVVMLFERSTTPIPYFHPAFTSGDLCYLSVASGETLDSAIKNVGANSFDIDTGEASGTYDYIVLVDGLIINIRQHEGNNNADGSVIHTTGTPRLLITEDYDSVQNTTLVGLGIFNQTYNSVDDYYRLDLDSADVATADMADFNAHCIKCRNTNGKINGAASFADIVICDPPPKGRGQSRGVPHA